MDILSDLIGNISFTHQIEKDAYKFLEYHGYKEIAEHSNKVANEAEKLAKRFNVDSVSSRMASYLHDVGRVFSDNQSVDIAAKLGIQIIGEEHTYAGLLHQKISKVLAYELFGIKDISILNAIECHTTLKAGASDIDLVLFIADKLSWDSSDSKPILSGILNGLEESLKHGAFSYISYLYENRNDIKVLHPWTLEAYNDLKVKCMKSNRNK